MDRLTKLAAKSNAAVGESYKGQNLRPELVIPCIFGPCAYVAMVEIAMGGDNVMQGWPFCPFGSPNRKKLAYPLIIFQGINEAP